jgi:hypothetical protein
VDDDDAFSLDQRFRFQKNPVFCTYFCETHSTPKSANEHFLKKLFAECLPRFQNPFSESSRFYFFRIWSVFFVFPLFCC